MRHIEPYLVYITYYYIIISLPELAKLVDFLMLRFFSGQIVHEIIIIKQKATNNGTKKTQEKPSGSSLRVRGFNAWRTVPSKGVVLQNAYSTRCA